jgi:tRNA nucleotidyltransferase (CCA-adding enzyme)
MIKDPKSLRLKYDLIRASYDNQPELAFQDLMDHKRLPFLEDQIGYDQCNPHHDRLLWDHTLEVVKQTKLMGGSPLAVLTALLHDIAKPVQYQNVFICECGARNRINKGSLFVKDLPGCDHSIQDWTFDKKQFISHDKLGATMAFNLLTDLSFTYKDIDAIVLIIDLHQQDYRIASPKVVKKFIDTVGLELAPDFIAFLKGDRLGHAPGEYSTIDYLETLEKELGIK